MKKIYMISYYFAPLGRADGVNRSYLVKYLSEMGWDMEVVACSNPHAFMRNFQKDESLLKIIPSKVKVHHVRSPYWGPVGNIAAVLGLLPDPFLNWYRTAVREGMQMISSPGMIYAVAPPLVNILVADKIAEQTGFPLVIDLRDNLFQIPRKMVPRVRGLVASTPFSLKEMLRYYEIEQQKGHVMYNGFPDDAQVQADVVQRSYHTELSLVYAGLMNLDQDPGIIIQAIKRLEKMRPATKEKIQVNFFGPSNYYTKLFLQGKLNGQFRFHGYLPFADVVKKIAASDMALTSLRGSPLSRGTNKSYCIPSKVYQYIATETPIFGIGTEGGALAELIREQDIGMFAPYSDIQKQAECLYALLTKKERLKPMQENLRKLKPAMAMRNQVEHLDAFLKTIRS